METPASKVPCRFFRSGDCRYGTRCKFSHDLGSAPETGTTSQSSQSSGLSSPTTSTSDTRPRRGANTAQRGFCNFYWNTGQCSYGFDCAYKHQKNPNPLGANPNTRGGTEDERSAANAALKYFTVDNLMQMAGVGLRTAQEGTPENAHNAIKQYLGGRPLVSVSEMKPLAAILASVNHRNRSWTMDKAQEFLDLIVRNDRLLGRIGDILKFTDVSPRAGTGIGLLSFQLDYFPILEFFTSDLVLKSTLHHNINALYTLVYQNWKTVSVVIGPCMQSMISHRTWNDITPGLPENLQGNLTGAVVFRTLAELVIQVFHRFKTALERYPQLDELATHLTEWFDIWAIGIQSQPPTFRDPVTSSLETCQMTVRTLGETIERLSSIIGREHHATESRRVVTKKAVLSESEKNQALRMRLEQTYDPPGNLRPQGPRHDNDSANIVEIRICPTSEELTCQLPPYLPASIPGAPHHLPADSMERHLDVQFRLLREDLTFPIRESLKVLRHDLDEMWTQSNGNKTEQTELEKVLEKGGGLYRSPGKNSVVFSLYTNVRYGGLSTGTRGFSIGLWIRSPPGVARDPEQQKRVDYWKHAGSKRLTSGSLVALVIASRGSSRAYLANIVSSVDDIIESARHSVKDIQIKATFFDPEVEIEALRKEKITVDENTFALLIDNGVMFESVRPFLKTLNTMDSTSIPFRRYICSQDTLDNADIRPPKYATAPGFHFKLQSVANTGHVIDPLDINDPASVARARAQLQKFSVLDPSQADSVVDSLTREVSLIQGPPGTGKSYTGKEILRILFDNDIKPVVLIAFTNHALDHMLSSVLDAKITEKLVRLGSRSTDERIGEYSLWKLERTFDDASMNNAIKRGYAVKKRTEEEMYKVMNNIQIPEPSEEQIKEYLQTNWPDHLSAMYEPPFWIAEYAEQTWCLEDEGEWKVVEGKKGKGRPQNHLMTHTFYGFWKRGLDIAFIQPPQARYVEVPLRNQQKKQGWQNVPPEIKLVQPTPDELERYRERMFEFFDELGFGESIPPVPSGSRQFVQLQDSPNVWSMSVEERHQLAKHWEEEIRQLAYRNHLEEYRELRRRYDEMCERYDEVSDERRRRLLRDIDLIGCTTTGAAKLTSLLTSVQPRVLVVEEAGQVLEAHILASLVDSVQHLICIGDPKQLRPNLATFSLSMDSSSGKELFKFDRSMMERLAENGFPMSQINVQRRMRPAISHYIRKILYPKLEDNEIVKSYPDVKGLSENVVFFTHNHKEDGGQESVSKVNTFEVSMIVDLVMHLLNQGEYNGQGDIAVLCAYLGQLQRLRAVLRSSKVTVAVDERDEDQLVKQGLQDEVEAPPIEEVSVSRHVRLGTVDIFQGQEAKIVIVSLVRNSGDFDADNASIGFLKSENRINVALSRAKHGLYITGNASNLRKDPTWSTILDEMEKEGQIMGGFPIMCPRHPGKVEIVSEPDKLPIIAPLGGCRIPCKFKLSCGHICRSLCHADFDNHKSARCYEKCVRLACARQHPCNRFCYESCDNCEFPISDVTLPCGHIKNQIMCYQLEDLASVRCQKVVEKKLPRCEHSKKVACYTDPASVACTEPCGRLMECCSKECRGRCGECQKKNLDVNEARSGLIARINHATHPCERALYCQHLCGSPCHSKDQGCNNECKKPCRQRCVHYECQKHCSAPCTPCLKACPWKCVHHECPVACGSICARLPCDEPCPEMLECTHPCPSVCGEPCSIQKCVFCMSDDKKTTIVDLIMQRPISEIDTTSPDMSEKLIALECGHIFTVETLDGHCSMSEYYDVDPVNGCCLAMKAPPIKFQLPPACPTCRGPFTSPRYGRVTKRANLDILEQNVASNMSKRLEKHVQTLDVVAATLEESETLAKAIENGDDFASEDDFAQICKSREDLFGKPDEPLPVKALKQLKTFHGFSPREAFQWNKIVREINLLYEAVVGVTSARSAHVKAYEAAMTTLFELEMKTFDPSTANGKTQREVAFAAASAKIGQPPYKADRKYHIEAFLLSIELRLMLARIASTRLSQIPSTPGDPDNGPRHRKIWASFVSFLYDSCTRDCGKATSLALSCSALRQEARVGMAGLRCKFEKDQFEALEGRLMIQNSDNSGEERARMRESLGELVSQRMGDAREALLQAERRYFQNRPANSQEEKESEEMWFRENCTSRTENILAAYQELLEQVLKEVVFYQRLTLQEKRDIAVSFGYGGRFLNCGNGHTFVITECGQPRQASTCPECGLPIGGDHDLHPSNTPATDFPPP